MTPDPTNPVLAVELGPCPFCGGPAMKPIRNNGTDATGCQDTKCAGGDVLSPVSLWNRRAHLSQGWKPDREAVIAILAENLPLTCGYRCGREITGAEERECQEATATEILALPTPAPKDEGWRPIESAPKDQPSEEFLEFKEALSDVRSLRQEHRDLTGGGPGWSTRWDAAWKAVDELFANEDEAAWCRQQEDAHG